MAVMANHRNHASSASPARPVHGGRASLTVGVVMGAFRVLSIVALPDDEQMSGW